MAELVAETPVTMEDTAPVDVDESREETSATADDKALVTTNAEGKRVIKKIIKKKKRPARPQVDPATFKTEPPPQTGVYTIVLVLIAGRY